MITMKIKGDYNYSKNITLNQDEHLIQFIYKRSETSNYNNFVEIRDIVIGGVEHGEFLYCYNESKSKEEETIMTDACENQKWDVFSELNINKNNLKELNQTDFIQPTNIIFHYSSIMRSDCPVFTDKVRDYDVITIDDKIFLCNLADLIICPEYNLVFNIKGLISETNSYCSKADVNNSNSDYNFINELCEDNFIGPIKSSKKTDENLNKELNQPDLFFMSINEPSQSNFSDFDIVKKFSDDVLFSKNKNKENYGSIYFKPGHIFGLFSLNKSQIESISPDNNNSTFINEKENKDNDNLTKIYNESESTEYLASLNERDEIEVIRNPKYLKNLGSIIEYVKIIPKLSESTVLNYLKIKQMNKDIDNTNKIKDFFTNSGIVIKYNEGDTCISHQNENETEKYSTVLLVFCSKESIFSEPIYVGRKNCTFYFEMYSYYACPNCLKSELEPLVNTCSNGKKTLYYQESQSCSINKDLESLLKSYGNYTANFQMIFSIMKNVLTPVDLINNTILSYYSNNIKTLRDYIFLQAKNKITNKHNIYNEYIGNKQDREINLDDLDNEFNLNDILTDYIVIENCSTFSEMSPLMRIIVIVFPLLYLVFVGVLVMLVIKYRRLSSEYKLLSSGDTESQIQNNNSVNLS